MPLHFETPHPLIALGVTACTAGTDAVYVMFTAAVAARRRTVAASWSSVWYLLSAFAVISYTGNASYVIFAALGSWIGAYGAVTWLVKKTDPARTTAGLPTAARPPSTSLH